MTTVYFVMQQTFFFTIPLLIVALGGMFSERAGIVNIALEGKMLLGAFASIFFINQVQNSGWGWTATGCCFSRCLLLRQPVLLPRLRMRMRLSA